MNNFFRGLLVTGLLASAAISQPGMGRAQDLTIASSMPSLEFPFFVHMQGSSRAQAESLGGITLIETDGQNSTRSRPPTSRPPSSAASTASSSARSTRWPWRRRCSRRWRPASRSSPSTAGGRRGRHPRPCRRRQRPRRRGAGAQSDHGAVPGRRPHRQPAGPARLQPGHRPQQAGVHNVLDSMSDKYVFVAEQTANFAREQGASVTEAILAGLDSPPDVIVAANDDMALGRPSGRAGEGARHRRSSASTRCPRRSPRSGTAGLRRPSSSSPAARAQGPCRLWSVICARARRRNRLSCCSRSRSQQTTSIRRNGWANSSRQRRLLPYPAAGRSPAAGALAAGADGICEWA
jgi:inositol transport system substrate-binding protein